MALDQQTIGRLVAFLRLPASNSTMVHESNVYFRVKTFRHLLPLATPPIIILCLLGMLHYYVKECVH